MSKVRLIKLYENRKEVGKLTQKFMAENKITKESLTKMGISRYSINKFLKGDIKSVASFAKCFSKFKLVLGNQLYSVIE